MKRISATLVAALAFTFALPAAEGTWLTNVDKAKAQAQKEKKLVLLDFTGSDWCPPCKALHKNVLSQKEFLDFAKNNLVLVELDFPRAKPQSDEQKKHNQEQSRQFNVEGYPTIIILNANGKELKRDVGYNGDSAKAFVAKIEKLK